MATLQKIRSHGALVILIVGAAMLAFIIGDFLNSGAAFFSRSRETVAQIAGNKVSITDFEKSINQLQEVYKIESGRQDFDENTANQIRQQVWQEYLSKNALQSMAGNAGMTVTAKELTDQCIGANPSQLITQRRAFFDETGNYNRSIFMQFYQAVHSDDAQNNPQLQAYLNYWNYWENAIAANYLQQKYNALISNAIVANKLDAKANFDARATNKTVDFVEQSYFSVPDSLVKVSDSEIRSLYNKKKETHYKQTPNRSIEYILFPVEPSEEDFAEVSKVMDSFKEEFATIPADELAALVNANSDVLYDGRNYSKTTIPEQYKDFAFTAKAGAVTDINFADNRYSMARLIENGYSLPDSVKLRVINLPENNKEQIDSIINAIKKGAKFADMVEKYDGQADEEKFGWLTETSLGTEISALAFHAKKNDLFSLPAGMGAQIFQVADMTKATPKAKVAIFEREVKASSKTNGKIYNSAREFITANNTEEKFKAAAAEQGKALIPATNINRNQEQINGLPQSRRVVRWAFEAKEGDVSDIYECGSNIIVATLTNVNESEYRNIADVSAELRNELANEKKAVMLEEKMQGAASLEELASRLGTDVKTADNVHLSSGYFGPAGQEPLLVGQAFALNDGEISQPVKGGRGVYVISPKETKTEDSAFNEQSEIDNLNQRYAYSLPQYGMFSLSERCINWFVDEKLEVVDNRANFY